MPTTFATTQPALAGRTLYAVLRRGGVTLTTVSMSESPPGAFAGHVPEWIAPGSLDVTAYQQAGASPDPALDWPVAILSISIDKADLRGVNPWRLRIAVASDDRDDWRVVGGIYNPLTGTVTAPVLHFSRYALCVE